MPRNRFEVGVAEPVIGTSAPAFPRVVRLPPRQLTLQADACIFSTLFRIPLSRPRLNPTLGATCVFLRAALTAPHAG